MQTDIDEPLTTRPLVAPVLPTGTFGYVCLASLSFSAFEGSASTSRASCHAKGSVFPQGNRIKGARLGSGLVPKQLTFRYDETFATGLGTDKSFYVSDRNVSYVHH
jgi:hypothetical protein